jgi:hypothetical protein
VKYSSGHKYQLLERWTEETGIASPTDSSHGQFLSLTAGGTLSIEAGYAWDGPSGPAVDTPTFMVASLVHDALYQMIRHGQLSASARAQADWTLYTVARRSGMPQWRALYCLVAVRLFAAAAAGSGSIRRTNEAQ